MRTLILGANSMLGWALFQRLRPGGAAGTCSPSTRRPQGSGLESLDMLDHRALRDLLERSRPELVLHCAAICKVDKCERHPDYAWSVNVGGTQNLLDWLPRAARLVYLSSDHVFSGENGPYREDSPPDPLSHYGRTRVEAERRVLEQHPGSLVVRAPLCIGPSYNGRSGHLDWLRHRHARGLPMTIVEDEYRSALPLDLAAERVDRMACSDLRGLRHLHADRLVSRPELAIYLSRLQGLQVQLRLQSRAERPVPHLGKVELATLFSDPLAQPLPSAVPDHARPLAQARV
jgi:dTDP-4-dehydrorhamnose reductase